MKLGRLGKELDLPPGSCTAPKYKDLMFTDNVGIVAASLENGIEQWDQFFNYRQSSDIVTNLRQKVRVIFLLKEGSLPIKLIEPRDPTSAVASLSGQVVTRVDQLRLEITTLG